MAALTVQDAPVTGLDSVTFVAADVAGDTVDSGAGVVLLVKNDDVSAHTATVDTPGTVSGLAIENPGLTVAASDQGAIPLPTGVFGATASITYDAVTSVTVAAIRLTR